MPNNNWLSRLSTAGNGVSINDRAVDAWQRINDNPAMVHSIVLHRHGVKQSAQTFRVEFGESGREVSDANDNSTRHQIVATVFGVRNHPDASVLDADIEVDDEFGIDGVRYRVKTVLPFAGEIQAQVYRVE
jgi:hypothetical protein